MNYFQCCMCKDLKTLSNSELYGIIPGTLKSEKIKCCSRRMRTLSETQYNSEKKLFDDGHRKRVEK